MIFFTPVRNAQSEAIKTNRHTKRTCARTHTHPPAPRMFCTSDPRGQGSVAGATDQSNKEALIICDWFPAFSLPSRRRARTSKTVLLPRLSICLWPAQPARPVVYFVCWFPGLSLLGACPIHLHLPFWKALENQEEVSEKVGQACLAPVSPLDFRQRSRGFNLC